MCKWKENKLINEILNNITKSKLYMYIKLTKETSGKLVIPEVETLYAVRRPSLLDDINVSLISKSNLLFRKWIAFHDTKSF